MTRCPPAQQKSTATLTIREQEIKSELKKPPSDDRPSQADVEAQLKTLTSQFQDAIRAQHEKIFKSSNDGEGRENSQFKWLEGGIQLELTPSQDELKENMKTQLVSCCIEDEVAES